IPYGQGFALNGTKSLVKLKTLNVGKFPFSKRTPTTGRTRRPDTSGSRHKPPRQNGTIGKNVQYLFW
ncbi:hypothetical protein M5L65_005614, partial [Citrobacter freundii]